MTDQQRIGRETKVGWSAVEREAESLRIAHFAIEESVRELGAQSAAQERLKSRAFAVVGLTVTISAFMVGAAFDSSQRGWRFYAPMTIGSVLILVLVWQLWRVQKPIEDWRRRIDPVILIEDFAHGDPQVKLLHLAGLYRQALDCNQSKLETLNSRVQQMTMVAGVCVSVWITMLWLVAN